MGQKTQILQFLNEEGTWRSAFELIQKFGSNSLFESLYELCEKKRIDMRNDALDHELPKLKYKITEAGRAALSDPLLILK